MNRSYQSNWETIGSSAEPDVLYYNASIVNNNTDDLINGFAFQDPLVKFNETRDQAIVSDASKYQFSIVRFVVNGGNLDLPLFIPQIQSFTGQFDPNLTEYGVGISLRVPVVNSNTVASTYLLCPPLTYLIFTPENLNPITAPLPQPPCAPNFTFTINNGIWDAGTAYSQNQIVTADASYTLYYKALGNPPAGTPLGATYVDAQNVVRPWWEAVSPELGRAQDVSTRYYWVNNYQTMVNMMNTAFVNANTALWTSFNTAWVAYGNGNTSGNSPFLTFDAWVAIYPTPVMNYDSTTYLFNITYPDVYLNTNPSLLAINLWFNTNTYGLFANFLSSYYNKPAGDGSLGAVLSGTNIGPFLPGYAYKMNVQYLNLGANKIAPADIFPLVPTYTGNFIRMTQEYLSVSTLWCPVESIVFISNLLPLQNEQTAPPNQYGTGNVGNSTSVAQSAFQPIITDVANSLGTDPTAWRKMLYYAPTAEYRMADFQNSKTEIKNIDVQVFWKNRLNNQLYPLSMFNLSSVSIKIMFRKKNALMNMTV